MQVIYVHGVSERPWAVEYSYRMAHRHELFEKFVTAPYGSRITKFADASWGEKIPLISISETQMMGDLDLQEPIKIDVELMRADNGSVGAADALEAVAMQATLSEGEFVALNSAVDALADQGIRMTGPLEGIPAALVAEVRALASSDARGNRGKYDIAAEALSRCMQRPTEEAIRQLKGRDWLAHELARRWKDAIYYIGAGRAEITNVVFKKIATHTESDDGDPIILLGHSLGALVCWDVLQSRQFETWVQQKQRRVIFLALGSQLQSYLELKILQTLEMPDHLISSVNWCHIRDSNDPLSFPVKVPGREFVCKTGLNWFHAHTSYLESRKILGTIGEVVDKLNREWV